MTDTLRARRLLDDRVSLERAYAEINHAPTNELTESTKQTAEWLNAHGSRAELKRWGANHPQRDLLRAYIVQLRKNRTRRTIPGGPHG